MLIIRREQKQVLSQSVVNQFEDRLFLHLHKAWPEECRQLGASRVRECIQHGIRRASDYGVQAERGVCQFIDVMFALGDDFDKNPRFPWVAKTLQDASLTPRGKMAALCEHTEAELKRLAGQS